MDQKSKVLQKFTAEVKKKNSLHNTLLILTQPHKTDPLILTNLKKKLFMRLSVSS